LKTLKMSGLDVLGSVASVLQLAATVYSISKTLYEVGDALSNAPSDIKDLARDLETFSEELHLLSTLLDGRNSRYSDRVYKLTAKIIGDCATICQKIDRVLKKLRSGGLWSRVKWVYKEKEILKLLTRLRDLKLSLMGTLSLLSALKADTMMDAMGVGTTSLLEGAKDEKAAKQAAKDMEDARQKLAGIALGQDQGTPSFLPQQSWTSGASQATTVCSSQRKLPSPKQSAIRSLGIASSSNPFVSSFALPAQDFPGANSIMKNPAAMESIQSFHTAHSSLEDDDVQMGPPARDMGPTFAANDHSKQIAPISRANNISDSFLYQQWKNDTIQIGINHFQMTQDQAAVWAASVPIPDIEKLRHTSTLYSPHSPTPNYPSLIHSIPIPPIVPASGAHAPNSLQEQRRMVLPRMVNMSLQGSAHSKPWNSRIENFDDPAMQMPSSRVEFPPHIAHQQMYGQMQSMEYLPDRRMLGSSYKMHGLSDTMISNTPNPDLFNTGDNKLPYPNGGQDKPILPSFLSIPPPPLPLVDIVYASVPVQQYHSINVPNQHTTPRGRGSINNKPTYSLTPTMSSNGRRAYEAQSFQPTIAQVGSPPPSPQGDLDDYQAQPEQDPQMNYPPGYGVQETRMHCGMGQITPQAATMAAAATSSGTGYAYPIPDGTLSQTSPRMGGRVSVKQVAGRLSPKQMNNQSSVPPIPQEQLEMHSRSYNHSSHTPVAPTSSQSPFQSDGALSHRAPSCLDNNSLTQVQFQIPARKKQTPAQQSPAMATLNTPLRAPSQSSLDVIENAQATKPFSDMTDPDSFERSQGMPRIMQAVGANILDYEPRQSPARKRASTPSSRNGTP
jgi:hypothetical protein